MINKSRPNRNDRSENGNKTGIKAFATTPTINPKYGIGDGKPRLIVQRERVPKTPAIPQIPIPKLNQPSPAMKRNVPENASGKAKKHKSVAGMHPSNIKNEPRVHAL
jgi:hypothetical protein